jgi:hypothetical protein
LSLLWDPVARFILVTFFPKVPLGPSGTACHCGRGRALWHGLEYMEAFQRSHRATVDRVGCASTLYTGYPV